MKRGGSFKLSIAHETMDKLYIVVANMPYYSYIAKPRLRGHNIVFLSNII